jgi:hypothetical protein
MAANKRIYYATQAVQLRPQDGDLTVLTNSSYVTPKGIQSVGMTTNFNLTQMFTMGQQELYDNVEGTPEVEVTMQKTLDGTLPLYLLCMGGKVTSYGSGKQLAELSTNRVDFRLGVYPDTAISATGNPTFWVNCPGMYLSSIGYTLPIDGFAQEDVTLVGNNKVWQTGTALDHKTTAFDSTLTASSPVRRVNVNVAGSVLPTGTAGIRVPSGRTDFGGAPYFQSISVKANLGREAINELGRMAPYCRYVKFPLEITSEFSVIASDGDYVDANDFSGVTGCGNSYTNLVDKEVKVVVCGKESTDLLTIDLGSKNKLTSVNYTGADTTGGNATITYSFQTFNSFKVSVTGTFAAV